MQVAELEFVSIIQHPGGDYKQVGHLLPSMFLKLECPLSGTAVGDALSPTCSYYDHDGVSMSRDPIKVLCRPETLHHIRVLGWS